MKDARDESGSKKATWMLLLGGRACVKQLLSKRRRDGRVPWSW
jgi:hypothetical protein